MKKLFLGLALLSFLLLPLEAQAYRYSHIDGEFSIDLPDAPVGETIWGSDPDVPYIERHARYGAIGERATITRADLETGDAFDVRITFLKLEPDVAQGITEDEVKGYLVDDYKEDVLDNVKYNFSALDKGVKWAFISGTMVDKSNVLTQHSTHFLIGKQSITVVRIKYAAENPRYRDYYEKLKKSIIYIGK